MPPKHTQARGGRAVGGSRQPGEGQGAGRGQTPEGGQASRAGNPSTGRPLTPTGPGTHNPNDPYKRSFGFKSSSESLDQDVTTITGPRVSLWSGGGGPPSDPVPENVQQSRLRTATTEGSQISSSTARPAGFSNLPSPSALEEIRANVHGWRIGASAASVLEDIPFESLARMNEIQAALCKNIPQEEIRILVHHGHALNAMGEPRYVATAVRVLSNGRWGMLHSGEDADTVMLAHRNLLMKSFSKLGDAYH